MLRSKVLHHHFYWPKVMMQVQNGNEVLNRLVPCLKCMDLAYWVFHCHFWHIYQVSKNDDEKPCFLKQFGCRCSPNIYFCPCLLMFRVRIVHVEVEQKMSLDVPLGPWPYNKYLYIHGLYQGFKSEVLSNLISKGSYWSVLENISLPRRW